VLAPRRDNLSRLDQQLVDRMGGGERHARFVNGDINSLFPSPGE
jgi:hypothetical protein